MPPVHPPRAGVSVGAHRMYRGRRSRARDFTRNSYCRRQATAYDVRHENPHCVDSYHSRTGTDRRLQQTRTGTRNRLGQGSPGAQSRDGNPFDRRDRGHLHRARYQHGHRPHVAPRRPGRRSAAAQGGRATRRLPPRRRRAGTGRDARRTGRASNYRNRRRRAASQRSAARRRSGLQHFARRARRAAAHDGRSRLQHHARRAGARRQRPAECAECRSHGVQCRKTHRSHPSARAIV